MYIRKMEADLDQRLLRIANQFVNLSNAKYKEDVIFTDFQKYAIIAIEEAEIASLYPFVGQYAKVITMARISSIKTILSIW